MPEFQIQLQPGEDPDAVGAKLRAEGAQIQEDELESLTAVVAGTIAVVGLVRAIKSLWDDLQTGVIVDARGSSVVVSRNRDLPRGTVVVIKTSGERTQVNQPSQDTLRDLIDVALGAGGA